jgi:hypothetical protein
MRPFRDHESFLYFILSSINQTHADSIPYVRGTNFRTPTYIMIQIRTIIAAIAVKTSQVNAMNFIWAPDTEWDYVAELTGEVHGVTNTCDGILWLW